MKIVLITNLHFKASVIVVYYAGHFGTWGAHGGAHVRPTIYLNSNLTLSGKGTNEEPYTINQ